MAITDTKVFGEVNISGITEAIAADLPNHLTTRRLSDDSASSRGSNMCSSTFTYLLDALAPSSSIPVLFAGIKHDRVSCQWLQRMLGCARLADDYEYCGCLPVSCPQVRQQQGYQYLGKLLRHAAVACCA